MIVKGFGSISGRSKKLKNFEVKEQNALKRNSLFLLGAFSIENEADLFEKNWGKRISLAPIWSE